MSNAEKRHSVAQIEQAAQHLGLLMGELQVEIGAAALRAGAGIPMTPGVATIADRMELLTGEYVLFQELLWRHIKILRGLVEP